MDRTPEPTDETKPPRPEVIELAQRVRRLREERDWSMRELGRRAGINGGYISLLERCKIESPSWDHMVKLARVFGLTTDQLLGQSRVPLKITPPRRQLSQNAYRRMRQLLAELMDVVLQEEGYDIEGQRRRDES